MIHTEVVLQGDSGKGLGGSLNTDMLLGLNSLVETIAPAATLHDTACLLINNLDLAIDNDILVILVEHGVSLEQLLESMHALALQGIVG